MDEQCNVKDHARLGFIFLPINDPKGQFYKEH